MCIFLWSTCSVSWEPAHSHWGTERNVSHIGFWKRSFLYSSSMSLGVLLGLLHFIANDLFRDVRLQLQGSYYSLQRGASLVFLIYRVLIHCALVQSLGNECSSVHFPGRFFLPPVFSAGCWLPFPYDNEHGCMLLPTAITLTWGRCIYVHLPLCLWWPQRNALECSWLKELLLIRNPSVTLSVS